MKRVFTAFALSAMALAVAPSAANAEKSYTMKIGFPTINDSNHLYAKWIKEQMDKRSGGRIEVKIFPAGQLGKIPRQIEAIQFGTQEVFMAPPGFFVGINKAFMVTDAPGLFDSTLHQHRSVNHAKFRDAFLKLGQKKGFIGGTVWSCGETSIATLKPLRKLEDMKGRKIRVLATELERRVIEVAGGTGVPMPYTEVLPAMQRKVIDGVRSGVIVMYPSKFYTVAKNLTTAGTGHIACGKWISQAWLKKLPNDLRDLVFQVGREATPHVGKWGHELTVKAEENWGKVAAIHRLSEEDSKEFRRRVRPIAETILGGDPATRDMYQLLKEAAAATR